MAPEIIGLDETNVFDVSFISNDPGLPAGGSGKSG